MAYSKPLRVECDAAGCQKTATIEVFNAKNATIGRFCKACGHRAKIRQMKLEGARAIDAEG